MLRVQNGKAEFDMQRRVEAGGTPQPRTPGATPATVGPEQLEFSPSLTTAFATNPQMARDVMREVERNEGLGRGAPPGEVLSKQARNQVSQVKSRTKAHVCRDWVRHLSRLRLSLVSSRPLSIDSVCCHGAHNVISPPASITRYHYQISEATHK